MKKLKKFFGVFAVALLLMSMTSSSINQLNKAELEQIKTPDSWCQGMSQFAVTAYAETHPNATYDELYDAHVAFYAACIVSEAVFQAGNW